MEDIMFEASRLSAIVDAQVAQRLKPGTMLDLAEMIKLAMLLDEAILAIIQGAEKGEDATNHLTQIAVVASYLRRANVVGRTITRM